ncbi:MAG TPA: DSD1 family PLP-dependent enzyme [Burkholderiales bacterium]|nr:DSD1 family PLP-dependent enzyme [Burkholderiales bacterium]
MSFHIPCPAEPGMPVAEVDTPALLLDLAAFDSNLDRMDASLAGKQIRLRPHAKSHKCPEIALRQMAHGAVGVCCQKVTEAEAMVAGGIPDVLISNQVVGARKIERLMALAQRVRVSVLVDDAANVAALNDAAARHKVTLNVLVEVNVGANRCGVPPGKAASALARTVVSSTHLRFRGIHAYQGAAQHVRSAEERQVLIARAVQMVSDTTALLEAAGIKCEIVTGAGTGTYLLEAASGVYNELQPGSYIFMDADYARNLREDGETVQVFSHSLFVWTSVMSHTKPGRAIVDAGLKALSVDSGMPVVAQAGAEYLGASDEHGVLRVDDASSYPLGHKLRLIPGHCDPTVNLHDWIVGYRGQTVEAVWPITARGALF